MAYRDPLAEWMFSDELGLRPQLAAEQHLAEMRQALQELEAYLKRPPAKTLRGRSLFNLKLAGLHLRRSLPPAELALAERLYRRLYEVGGTGTTYVQEALLNAIGVSRSQSSIPFWLEILGWSRPRDAFARPRRTLALAALAYLAIGGAAEAEAALRQAAYHANPDVRALAVYYWARLYVETERSLPKDVLTEIRELALHAPDFGSRFHARTLLRWARRAAPLDNPGGVYAFKVGFKRARRTQRVSRTIELRSEQTLDDLHHAIQRAIEWDSDHLYSFYLNGDKNDDTYRFSCPYEEDRPPWTDDAIIGELGLMRRHKFAYLFDYGDNHLFEIDVADIRPTAERGKYPRVVESKGEAPEQYPSHS